MPKMIFVDRRKTSQGKSYPNRQRLLNRIRKFIIASKPKADDKSIKNSGGHVDPISVNKNALAEYRFSYKNGTGNNDIVLPGNHRRIVRNKAAAILNSIIGGNTPVQDEHYPALERGDEIQLPRQDENEGEDGDDTGQAGNGENGEGNLIEISRQEFYNFFFEDCELPNIDESANRVIPEEKFVRAGFKKSGHPGQLSVLRSMKNGIMRKRVLEAKIDEDIQECNDPLLIEELIKKKESIPLFDDIDLRYRKFEKQQIKQIDAVMIMIMDISGSMSDDRKSCAREFFALQFAFISKKYPHIDVVFIAYTTDAMEMNEQEFFTTTINGGTKVSPALKLANEIIDKRYNPSLTNIYISMASDGDNEFEDINRVNAELEHPGLLAKCRHMSFVHTIGNFYGNSNFISQIKYLSSNTNKLSYQRISNSTEVYQAFKNIYRK